MVSSLLEAKTGCEILREHRELSVIRSRVSRVTLIGSKPGVITEGTESETGESMFISVGVFFKFVIYSKNHSSGSEQKTIM